MWKSFLQYPLARIAIKKAPKMRPMQMRMFRIIGEDSQKPSSLINSSKERFFGKAQKVELLRRRVCYNVSWKVTTFWRALNTSWRLQTSKSQFKGLLYRVSLLTGKLNVGNSTKSLSFRSNSSILAEQFGGRWKVFRRLSDRSRWESSGYWRRTWCS